MIKLLWNKKDGGPESNVVCWGIEIKSLFSILVLNFKQGSREAFHSHAFNSISWLFSGALKETFLVKDSVLYVPNIKPIIIKKDPPHKVYGIFKNNWVVSFRGPWQKTWVDVEPNTTKTLTHGRKVVNETPN